MRFTFIIFIFNILPIIQIVFADTAESIICPTKWQNPEQIKVKNQDIAFNNLKYNFPMSDSVYFMSYFNDGWVLMLSLFRLKYGPIEKWGIYSIVSEPDGTSYWATHQIDKKNIITEPNRLFVKDENNCIYGNDMTYYIKLDFENFSCNLTYKNILPPWQLDDNRVYISKDKQAFFRLIVISPWAMVTGTITLDNKTINVKGQGYGDRFLSVNPLRKMNPYVYSIRTFSKANTDPKNRWFFGLLENITHKSYGSKRIPLLLLAYGNKWLLITQDYTIETTDYEYNPNTLYKYPTRIKIKCSTHGYKLEGEYLVQKLFNFTDVLGEFPNFIRKILLLYFNRPVYFRSSGEFLGTLTMPNGTVYNLHLFGPHEYILVK